MVVPTLTREQEQLLARALEVRDARQRFAAYARLVSGDDYAQPPQVVALIDLLQRVEAGEVKRAIVEMPPRSSKSTHISRLFPSWWLGRHPTDNVILSSYGQELATGHGRAVRDLLGHPRYPFATRLRGDVKAAGRWQTVEGGGLIAAGVGTGLTGFGGNLVVLDDPIKDRQEAESEIVRNHTWDWYQDVLSTRVMRDGAVVVLGCLTGETPVLLADGAEMPICDIRPGASVATYDGERLTTSTVTNWSNKGAHAIYAIKTSSGKIVRANARHPWLVERDGEIAWRRTATLKRGDAILRVTGGSGVEWSARSKAARSKPPAKDTAIPTTARRDGPVGIDRHLTTRSHCGNLTSAIAMESDKTSTNVSLPSKVASALSVVSHLPQRTLGITGAATWPSIMTMRRIAFEGFSATTATLPWDMGALPPDSPLPRDTSSLTPDLILDITEDGVEDVFDIEVERTGTFVANGLVSHNTRWHEDDPIGRIIASPGASDWVRLRIPYLAEADDPLGRAVGTPLEVFGTVPSVEKGEISAYGFAALYQQSPSPAGGGVFKREWMQRRWQTLPTTDTRWRVYSSVDLGGKQGVGHDPSAIATWGTDGISFYLLDYWSSQAEYADVKAKVVEKFWEFAPRLVLVEDATWAQPLISDLRRETGVRMAPVPPVGSKWVRADAVSPLFEAGRIVLPQAAPWLDGWMHEHLSFPNAAHDEAVDTTSMALMRMAAEAFQVQKVAVGTQRRALNPIEQIKQQAEARKQQQPQRPVLGGLRG